MEFQFKKCRIPDVIIVKKKYFPDNRGSLIKEYELTPFLPMTGAPFFEEYISISAENVLRGLHYQKEPKAQGKLISVIKGEIFDVAVDIRKDSKTFLNYVVNIINSDSNESIWIPPGFAHGFLSLTEGSVVLNRCTTEIFLSLENGVLWNDPVIDIVWPTKNPILSEKDGKWPLISK